MNCICKKCGYFINDKAREYKEVIEHLEELEKEKNRVNIVNFVLQKNRNPYDFIDKYGESICLRPVGTASIV